MKQKKKLPFKIGKKKEAKNNKPGPVRQKLVFHAHSAAEPGAGFPTPYYERVEIAFDYGWQGGVPEETAEAIKDSLKEILDCDAVLTDEEEQKERKQMEEAYHDEG